ncbi:phage tail protein [Acinetobacter baumannii]
MAIVKGAKKGKDKARQPVVAPDSAQSKTYIKVLYGLAEGEVEGPANGNQSIFLEETPLQDASGNTTFENVKVDFRNGTNDQDYIDGFPAVDSETAVGVELKSGTPWVRAFNNIDLDAIRIRFKWGPLRSQDATTGDVSGITIDYAIDLQTDGGPWTEVLKTKISDKTSANYERAHRIDLPKADSGWIVRVRRITPNSTSEYVSDKMYVEAVTEVVDAKLRYPNTALLGLQYDAETFGNVAKVAVDLKGALIQVPTNYDPQKREYTGIWDGTFKRAYTNNPAWVYYDLCTNDRYGLGNRLNPLMIDKWSLYRLAQYCDQTVPDGLGGQEPRFTCNVYLQSSEEAFNILMKLAGIFRAIAFWDGTSIHCDADIPQDTYFTYTRANVIGGMFEYSGTRARDRHNVVRVAWDNPANHYKTEYEFVRDENAIAEAGQVRILELDAWGCTSRGQAQRAGLWALKSEQSETRTVSFKVGLDGHIPLPGRVIEIADELFAGRANGGRVSKISVDLKSITLDRDNVVAKAGDRLVINGENGKAQTRIVQSISGRVITVTLPFDENSIAVQNVWVLDAQDLATMKFRVISITQEEKHQFSITALQYNPQKFNEIDDGAHFEEAPISIINPTLQEPVKDVLITTESRVEQGINVTTMIVSWTQAKGAVKYLVEWRKDDGSWIRLPQTGNNSVEVPGVYSGQYQARVTAISAFEIASLPVTSSLTEITGKQGLPPKLAFIRATGILFGMKLDWGFPPTGAKDTAYTEIEVSPDSINNIAQLGLFAYPTSTTTIQGLQPNLKQFYRGRIIDRIGNIGPWSEWTNGTTTADPDAVLDLISGHISESDLATELQGKIENSVDVSEAAQAAASNAQAVASSAQTAASNAQAVASEAKTAASSAQSAATSAQAQASLAQQEANDASVIAANAKNTADQAAKDASSATTAASKVANDLTTSTNQLNQKIADETIARTTAISQLNDGLTTETSQRKSEDTALLNNIETFKSSTKGSLSSLQEQITTNATNTSANAQKITSLDSRLTTNEGKTADAINSAATAQQTANTAVDKANAAANSVTALKSELSSGKGINSIIAPFSDPQELPALGGTGRSVALVDSALRRNGKAYKVSFTTAAHYVYFGTAQPAQAPSQMAMQVEAGRAYTFSVWLKTLSTVTPSFRFNLMWFIRDPSTGNITTNAGIVFPQGQTDSYISPNTNGQRYSFKSVNSPANAIGATVYIVGNPSGPASGEYLIDMLMLEESIGSDKPASTWIAGPADLSAIKSALDINATAINNLTTRVSNDEGIITSQGNAITQLNNSVNTINGTLSNKADATALSALTNRVSTAEGKITNQSDSIASLQNSVTSINGTLANKADSSAVNNLTSRVETAEGKISSQSGQITSLSNSLATTNNTLNDVNALARLLSLGKPLRDDPTFKTTSAGGLSAYSFPAGTSWVKQTKSTDNPTGSTHEMLIKATQALGGGWYPTAPTLVLTANKTFLIKQIIKMPVGTKLQAIGNATGTGGYIRILGNDLGTGKFETYYSVVQGGADLSGSTIQGHFRVIAGTNPPVPTVDNPVFVILASYEVFDVTAVNDTIPKAYSDAIAANANAINTLSNTVSQQGNTITSHSNSITQLNNSISSINGALSSKADASALQSLDSKVTLIDGKVTSNSSALTALQSSFEGIPNQGVNLLGPEISNPIEKPNWISGLPFEVIQSPDTVNVRAFQFTMPANTTSGTYFNIGGGQVPRQWLTEGTYIFSFVAKTVGGTPPHAIEWQLYNVDSTRLRFNITATLTRYSGVFTVPAGGAAACMLLIGNPTGKPAGQVINIERMMLERQVGNNTTPSAWIAGSASTGMILSTQAKATDLFNTATSQNAATAGRVTSLESRMTTTEGNLNKKADASALQNLDTKVTNVDGKVTSNTNAITALSSTLSNATSSISMNAGNAQGDWTFFNTSGEYSIVAQADGQAGRVIQLGNNAGNDIVWMHPNNFIPFDATKTYRLRARYRRRAGTGTIYLGISQKTPDKAQYVTTANALSNDMGSSNYVVNAHAPAVDEWQEITAYIKGRSAGAASGAGSQASPRTVSQMTGFITPMFLANYTNQTGIVELDYLILEDAEAIAGNQANATAISTLDTKVSDVDGRLTTATNSITSLSSRMNTAEGNISAANTALSGLSTRMTAAENGLTNQSNAITNLSNSLTVTTNTANAALPKIQGGTGAAKLFRGVLVWQQNGANLTGNIVIQTPITFTNKMFRFALTGYNYLAGKSDINLNIGGYAYSGTNILQHGVVNSGTVPIRVRLGVRNGTVVIILTSQAPGAYWQYPKFNMDAEIGYTTPPDSWADGWSASFMTEADLASNGISAIIEPSLLDVSTEIKANATAITDLSNTVTQQGNTITSHSNSITSLNNSITSINSSLTNKADASALNNLSNRVTAAEGNITSQGNSITSLNNTLTNNDLSNLVLNPDFIDPKSGWTAGVIVDATDAAPNPPSLKALRLNNRDSYYGPFVKCNVGDMFYVSAWFATPNTSATASAVIGLNTRNSAGTYAWYSVAIKSTDKNAWGFVEGYFTVPNGMVDIRPWLQVSTAAAEAAGQQWHVTNIQIRNITGNKKLASDLQATSSALSTLDSKVTNIDGRVTSASNNIVSLNNSVTNINTALSQKADAAALNSLSNRVTTAEGNITSQGNSITSLNNSLAVSGKGGTNLLIKSNVVGTYNGTAYPHHVYEMGEDWEVGAKYTLIWCAEHARGTGDGNSYLSVYAGGGNQSLQSIVNTGGKVVNKTTFTKSTAGTGKVINFYMINRPTADKNSIGTVYWAVLVKGDVLTTDAWIPSAYDYIPDSNANASAITNLTNTVTQQGNTLTSHTNSITSLNNSITNINGVLNTKANTSAVSDLDSRVTDAEGKITANTSSITSLTANLKSTSNGITMSASIDVDPDSEWIYWTKNGEVARADDTSALGGKVYRFGNNAGNDHVNARSKAKLPFDQNKTYRIRARYRRVSGTGTIYCAVFGIAKDGVSHVNSSNTVTTDAGSSNYFVSNQAPALNAWQEVTVYVKGRAAGAAAGGWTLDNPRQLPNATAFLSVQFLANYSNAAGEVDLDYLIIEDADAIAANDATAKALSSLDTRVTTAEGKITSQGNSITQLNNSITTINGTLSTKADSSALTNLANRVTTAENSITSQGSSITSLNSSVSGILKDIEVTDTRSTNQPPSWYYTNYPKRVVREFKQASVLGLTGMGTYVSLETYVYYSDATGGPLIQIARGSDSKLTAERRSASTAAWSTWTQDIKAISDGLANKAEASALSSLDSKVSVIDGKVSTQASSITTLQTTVGGHTSAIQQVTESVDGVKAQQFLKMDVNGHVAGHGSMNDGTTSTFIFNYDTIQFGAPAGVDGVAPKPIMSLLNNPLTLPNGTVIPRGLYVDSGSFGYINANRIWADNLSVISADLGSIKVKNANIDDGAISTLKIQDEAVTVPIGVTFPSNSNIPDFDNQLVDESSINAWFTWSNGKVASVTMARSGGKALISGGIMLKQFTVLTSINGNTTRADLASLISLIVGVYRNGTEIARHYFAPSNTQNNILYFSGSYTLPPTIDNAFSGSAEYSLRVAIGRNTTSVSNVKASYFKDASNQAALPFELTSRTLTVIELKK